MLPAGPLEFSFIRYVRLYSLHSVEQTATHRRILQARVAILQYTLTHLPGELDSVWKSEPAQGVVQAREFILPRLEGLLDDHSALAHSLVDVPRWQPYLSLRQNQSLPAIPQFPSLSTSINTLSYRLGQAERFLQLTKTALEVANAGLVLWQSWQKFRHEGRLLQDAIQATLLGHEGALQHALDPGFIPKYLAARGDDPAYSILFDEHSSESQT